MGNLVTLHSSALSFYCRLNLFVAGYKLVEFKSGSVQKCWSTDVAHLNLQTWHCHNSKTSTSIKISQDVVTQRNRNATIFRKEKKIPMCCLLFCQVYFLVSCFPVMQSSFLKGRPTLFFCFLQHAILKSVQFIPVFIIPRVTQKPIPINIKKKKII